MKKIFLITTTRADYGIMSRLIARMYDEAELDFHLIVTGMHLSEKFGNTINEISSPISFKIDIEIENKPSHAIALAITKFTELFKNEVPDIVILLGDRYETLGIATAAMLTNTPIAHIHGGESSEGAIDEAIRHSITKMSHLHFTSCEDYRKRVIQLGESPEKVFNVGAFGVENIIKTSLLTKEELEKSLDFKFSQEKNYLITFHPVSLETKEVGEQISALCHALLEIENAQYLFTMPNCDEGNEIIFEYINDFIKKCPYAKAYTSLGMLRYLSTLQFVDAIIGNSSSGIIEAPSFNIPTINIGSRQKGRIQASSILNCEPTKKSILQAMHTLENPEFQANVRKAINPYEQEDTAEKVVSIIKSFDYKSLLNKGFYSIDFNA